MKTSSDLGDRSRSGRILRQSRRGDSVSSLGWIILAFSLCAGTFSVTCPKSQSKETLGSPWV